MQDQAIRPKSLEACYPRALKHRRAKEVLYLRHVLQRALVSPDKAISVRDVEAASRYLSSIEGLGRIEAWILKETKICKVLKAIGKLDRGKIRLDSEYQITYRASRLLHSFNVIQLEEEEMETKEKEKQKKRAREEEKMKADGLSDRLAAFKIGGAAANSSSTDLCFGPGSEEGSRELSTVAVEE